MQVFAPCCFFVIYLYQQKQTIKINIMATQNQINKVERLANEIHSLWLEINENNDIYSSKELVKMQDKLDALEENLNRYCVKIKISEEQLFSIETVCNILDGVSYTDYILNY